MPQISRQTTLVDYNSKNHKENLTKKEVTRIAQDILAPSIPFKMRHNCIYSNADILRVLIKAASGKVCTENGSKSLNALSSKKAPDGDTVLYHIKKLSVDEINELFLINYHRTFRDAKSRGLLSGKFDIAIDFTDQMHYGNKNNPMVVGTQPKNGSSHAYKYASVSILENNQRFVLAAIPVDYFSKTVKIVENLLQRASSIINIDKVYFDRGFFSVDVISYLNDNNYKFLMPAKKNTKIKNIIRKGIVSEVVDYTMNSTHKNTKFKLVFMKEKEIGRTGLKRKRKVNENDQIKVFATNLSKKTLKNLDLFESYRKRWGIETSYRMFNIFRPRTTSVKYVVRLFYFLLSTYLYNLWVLTNIRVCSFYVLNPEKEKITSFIFINLVLLFIESADEGVSLS